ncbi:hypothetical protein [Desulfonatronospira sp.]|uniref:hypothetical protein n=1 Tax=Desulfonatronospira sp. TaxID=1962951 RepID=UPI0025C4A3E6|nr:hypothetical protein [Desulfonatronospira sp.]
MLNRYAKEKVQAVLEDVLGIEGPGLKDADDLSGSLQLPQPQDERGKDPHTRQLLEAVPRL